MDPVVRVAPTAGAGVSRLHSLRTKITLLVSVLLIVVISAFAIDSYTQVRGLAVARAKSRLESVSRQFAASSSENTRRRLEALTTLANSAAITRFMEAPVAANRVVARTELQRLLADSSVMKVRLRDQRNHIVLEVGSSSVTDTIHEPLLVPAGSFTAIGPPVVRSDSVIFISAAVIRSEGRQIGRLNVWRRVILSPAIRAQMSGLIGSDAAMYFGGGDPPTWVDLSGQVVAAPESTTGGEPFVRRNAAGEEQLAAVAPILGTPWLIAVEFPMSSVMAQPRAFLRRLIIALVVLLIVAMGLTWWMSGRVTKPLRRLTEAAESLASGVYNVRVDELVDLRKQDEISRLARAFWIMGMRVQDTHAQLQGELVERTDEMRATFKTLEKALEDRELKTGD